MNWGGGGGGEEGGSIVWGRYACDSYTTVSRVYGICTLTVQYMQAAGLLVWASTQYTTAQATQ